MLNNEHPFNEFVRQQKDNLHKDIEIIWKNKGNKIKWIPINENKAIIPARWIFHDSL